MRIAGPIGVVLLLATGCTSHTAGPAYVDLPGAIALLNPDFEAALMADGTIQGWSTGQHAPENPGDVDYKFDIDRGTSATGAASFRIERIHEQVYGVISQTVPISARVGHTIELTVQMKTSDVGPEGWELMLTFTGGVPNSRRAAKPLTGTQDFRKVTIRAPVPPGAQEVEIAAVLNDHGTAWLDDVHLRVVD